jgi:hypothetical protein
MSHHTISRPGHKITLYRRNNKFAPEDISQYIYAVNTSKRLGVAAGGFDLSAVHAEINDSGLPLHRYAKPMDVVLIELRGIEGVMEPVMVGLIMKPSREVKHNPQTGAFKYACKVVGQDMGRMFMVHDCGWDLMRLDLYSGDAESIRQARMATQGSFIQYSGTPAENINRALAALFWPPLGDWVKKFISDQAIVCKDDWVTWAKSITSRTGAMWNAMKAFADEPWNVLFTDTNAKGMFEVRLEQAPFDVVTGKLSGIPIDKVSEAVIHGESLGLSDQDMINFASFEAYAPLFGGDSFALMMTKQIKANDKLVAEYGFRAFKPQTEYVPWGDTKGPKPDMSAQIMARTEAIFNWHRRAHEYESGSFEMAGSTSKKIFRGLIIPERNMQFFVEGVRHVYSNSGSKVSYVTTLDVTRGQEHEQEL